ncbi:hypothetical protein HDU97_000002 [Phlyctochytrium planicorne]|nr:hypothetical protein HDU97_000002 [Phlyctochytrium planicorne]
MLGLQRRRKSSYSEPITSRQQQQQHQQQPPVPPIPPQLPINNSSSTTANGASRDPSKTYHPTASLSRRPAIEPPPPSPAFIQPQPIDHASPPPLPEGAFVKIETARKTFGTTKLSQAFPPPANSQHQQQQHQQKQLMMRGVAGGGSPTSASKPSSASSWNVHRTNNDGALPPLYPESSPKAKTRNHQIMSPADPLTPANAPNASSQQQQLPSTSPKFAWFASYSALAKKMGRSPKLPQQTQQHGQQKQKKSSPPSALHPNSPASSASSLVDRGDEDDRKSINTVASSIYLSDSTYPSDKRLSVASQSSETSHKRRFGKKIKDDDGRSFKSSSSPTLSFGFTQKQRRRGSSNTVDTVVTNEEFNVESMPFRIGKGGDDFAMGLMMLRSATAGPSPTSPHNGTLSPTSPYSPVSHFAAPTPMNQRTNSSPAPSTISTPRRFYHHREHSGQSIASSSTFGPVPSDGFTPTDSDNDDEDVASSKNGRVSAMSNATTTTTVPTLPHHFASAASPHPVPPTALSPSPSMASTVTTPSTKLRHILRHKDSSESSRGAFRAAIKHQKSFDSFGSVERMQHPQAHLFATGHPFNVPKPSQYYHVGVAAEGSPPPPPAPGVTYNQFWGEPDAEGNGSISSRGGTPVPLMSASNSLRAMTPVPSTPASLISLTQCPTPPPPPPSSLYSSPLASPMSLHHQRSGQSLNGGGGSPMVSPMPVANGERSLGAKISNMFMRAGGGGSSQQQQGFEERKVPDGSMMGGRSFSSKGVNLGGEAMVRGGSNAGSMAGGGGPVANCRKKKDRNGGAGGEKNGMGWSLDDGLEPMDGALTFSHTGMTIVEQILAGARRDEAQAAGR